MTLVSIAALCLIAVWIAWHVADGRSPIDDAQRELDKKRRRR